MTRRASRRWSAPCTSSSPQRVVLEATGGHETAAVTALQARGWRWRSSTPCRCAHFARSTGKLAKTDALDAQMLALFGERMQPEARPQPDATSQDVAALLARRRQLVEIQTAERNRRPTTRPAAPRVGGASGLAGRADPQVDQGCQTSPTIRSTQAKATVLRSIPGIGPSWRHVGRAAAGTGHARSSPDRRPGRGGPAQSGQWAAHGGRAIWGGRGAVRAVLYMATVSGIVHNPLLKPLYERLCARGKPTKVAMVACMRKLLTIANAMVRDGTVWSPQLAASD